MRDVLEVSSRCEEGLTVDGELALQLKGVVAAVLVQAGLQIRHFNNKSLSQIE